MIRVALLIAILMCGTTSIRGDEPAEAFLEALRENGYNEIALDYLIELENSDLITDEFKRVLPFEKAKTLAAMASRVSDYKQREELLGEAQQLLTGYAASNSSLEESAKSLRFQGGLLFQQADVYLKQSKSDRLTASEKLAFYEKARTVLKSSLVAYRKSKSQIARLIDPKSPDAILIDSQDPSTRKTRQRLKKTYTDVTVLVPMVIEQLADTYAEGDANRETHLLEAVDEYKKIWDAYNSKPREFRAGVQACIYAARCNQKLGNHKSALNLLAEVFDVGVLMPTSKLALRAYVLAADSWDQMTPYPHDTVIFRFEPLVKGLSRIEIRDPQWLRVQMALAVAKHAKAAEIKTNPGARSLVDAKTVDREAAKILRNVARVASPYRDQARELLSQWKIPVFALSETEEAVPATFEEARQQGRDRVIELESLANEASQIRREMRAAQGSPAQASLEKRQSELASQVQQVATKALATFDLAIQLADESTPRRDINDVRFLQSFCYFSTQRYYESALIGDYLLTTYPTIDGTRAAMSMMIQSYSILLDEAKDVDHEFEREQLATACAAVVKQWPGSAESGLAASTMTRLMLVDGDLFAADKYFREIPHDAGYRPGLSLRVGRRLWFDYREKHQQRNADPEKMKEQLRNATDYLKEGVDATTLESLNYDTAVSALLLVDAHLASGELDLALERLERSENVAIAPLDLVKMKHPSVTKTPKAKEFSRATYKTAIKVYLAAMRQGTDRPQWVTRANGVITAMRQEMEASQDPKDRARVTAIYQLIALELKAGFESITDPAEKKKFSGTLASFLGSIEEDSNDANTVLWAGATLLEVADSLAKSGMDVDAKSLFQQAVSALNRAEAIGFKGDPMESKREMELKRQRALALRGSGSFKAADQQFLEILTLSPSALKVQIDSAENLQMWAKATKRPRGYIEAINGTSLKMDPKTKRRQNQIWGWQKIMRATRGTEKYREPYFLSLSRNVECRLEYGVLDHQPDKIRDAKKIIVNERKRDKNFGGSPVWKAKFEALEKRIDAALK